MEIGASAHVVRVNQLQQHINSPQFLSIPPISSPHVHHWIIYNGQLTYFSRRWGGGKLKYLEEIHMENPQGEHAYSIQTANEA